jgi:Flp pilus assembly protein TadG
VTLGLGSEPAGRSAAAAQGSGERPGVRRAVVGAGAVAAEPEPRVRERGAAVVELLVVFLTLLLPLVYVMVVMADVQRALLATSSAAREVGRVYVTGSDRADAKRRAAVAYRDVLGAYGIGAGDSGAGMRLQVGCPAGAASSVAPAPLSSSVGPAPLPPAPLRLRSAAGCAGGFGPGAEVRVVVTYRVPVARLPFVGAVAGPGLTVGATHHTRVDRYRGLSG